MRAALRFAAALLVLAACHKTEPKAPAPIVVPDLLVGEIGSLTGSEATFGTSTRDGIDLAVGAFNNSGGLNGRKLRLDVVDDQGKPEEAATAATKLTQDKVIAIIGEVASSRTIAAANIAQAAKVPLITPTSTDAKITEIGNYIFRVCFVDSFQGTVMAMFSVEDLKATTAAIFRDGKSDYSMGLAKEFEDNFKRLTGEIVAEETYQAGDVDFKAQLTKIKAKKPDVLFVPGYYTDVGLIARQARELGVKAILLGGDGWDSPKLKEIGGDAIEGAYFSSHYSGQAQTPEVQSFIRSFKAAYGHEPDGIAAMGYDATVVMIDALKRAKSVDTTALRDALAQTNKVAGVTGHISIDANRNVAKSAVVLKVDKGELKFQTTISPYPFPN